MSPGLGGGIHGCGPPNACGASSGGGAPNSPNSGGRGDPLGDCHGVAPGVPVLSLTRFPSMADGTVGLHRIMLSHSTTVSDKLLHNEARH